MIVSTYLFALALSAAPASAQETAVRGPLRVVGGTDTFLGMISPARTDASGSHDVWLWVFHRDVKDAYAATYDTTAEHQRIDCTQRAVTPLRFELFYETEFLGNVAPAQPVTPRPTTLAGLVVTAVCDPGFEPEATFPDAASARAATTRHFAAQQPGGASGLP